jgi:Tfp pilus assembly protein PilZ
VEVGRIEARISDLSVGGLALQCAQPLHVNQEVLTQFSLPGVAGVVHITGRVVNVTASGRAGLRFSFVPEEDLNLIENWLAVELAKLEKAEMPSYNASQYSN